MRSLKIIFPLFLLVHTGCLAIPLLESARRAGITEGDRKSLISERVTGFNSTISWDDPMPALAYVDSESREEFSKRLRKQKKLERIVDIKVDAIDFEDGATEATATVTVRAFQVPFYVVKEREEQQKWIFRAGDGWMLNSIESEENGAK